MMNDVLRRRARSSSAATPRRQKEVAEIGLRFTWDPMPGDIVTEITLSPKAGTPLAKEIAANTTFSNRFAGLVPKDAAVGAIVKSPLFAKEIREIVAAILEAGQEELKADRGGPPSEFHPIVDEVAKALHWQRQEGDLRRRGRAGWSGQRRQVHVVVGISIDDSAAVEKALRQVVKAPELAKLVGLDVDKVGDVNIHKVALMNIFPERQRADFAKVFGTEPPGYVAFDKDAVFIAIGPEALASIKAAIESKPGPAAFLDATANMKRLHAMVVRRPRRTSAAEFAKMMGTDDKIGEHAPHFGRRRREAHGEGHVQRPRAPEDNDELPRRCSGSPAAALDQVVGVPPFHCGLGWPGLSLRSPGRRNRGVSKPPRQPPTRTLEAVLSRLVHFGRDAAVFPVRAPPGRSSHASLQPGPCWRPVRCS